MKYIVKNIDAPAVLAHEAELVTCHLDETSLSGTNDQFPSYSGADLYNLVRDMATFPALKEQLYEDQGGICCYCGMKLDYPFDPQYRVEHVIPKEIHRELVGEYKNLLLSCRATKEETDARNAAPKKTRRDFMHCDEKKGSSEITYSPLAHECEAVFVYKQNGEIVGTNENATNDIKTLGLNCNYLVRRRKEALEVLFDGDELLSDDLLREFKEKVMTRDANNRLAEFCFVISNVIRQILS
jgi:uncharacterized protein (TIGR02646 family)